MARRPVKQLPFKTYHADAVDTAARLRREGWQPARICDDPRVCGVDYHPDIQRRPFYTKISRADPLAPAQPEDWVISIGDAPEPTVRDSQQAPAAQPRQPTRFPTRPTVDYSPRSGVGPLFKMMEQMRMELATLTAKVNAGALGARPSRSVSADAPRGNAARLERVLPKNDPAGDLARLRQYANLETPAGRKLYAQMLAQATKPTKPQKPSQSSTRRPAAARATGAARAAPRSPAPLTLAEMRRRAGTASFVRPSSTPPRPATTTTPRPPTTSRPAPIARPTVTTGTPRTMLTSNGPSPNLYPNATTRPAPRVRGFDQTQQGGDETKGGTKPKPKPVAKIRPILKVTPPTKKPAEPKAKPPSQGKPPSSGAPKPKAQAPKKPPKAPKAPKPKGDGRGDEDKGDQGQDDQPPMTEEQVEDAYDAAYAALEEAFENGEITQEEFESAMQDLAEHQLENATGIDATDLIEDLEAITKGDEPPPGGGGEDDDNNDPDNDRDTGGEQDTGQDQDTDLEERNGDTGDEEIEGDEIGDEEIEGDEIGDEEIDTDDDYTADEIEDWSDFEDDGFEWDDDDEGFEADDD